MKYLSTNQLLESYSRYWKVDMFDMEFMWRILIGDNWPEMTSTHAFRDIDYRIFLKRYCKRNIRKQAFIMFKVQALELFYSIE